MARVAQTRSRAGIFAGAARERGYTLAMQVRARLGLYWFFATGALGLFFPYFALYLRESVGLAPSGVGLVMAVSPLVGLFAQPLWGQIADRTGSRTRTLSALAFGAGVGYLGLTLPEALPGALACTALYAIFGNPLMPMGAAVSMGALGHEAQGAFGRVRVWGTIGYLCSVLAAPQLLAAGGRLVGQPATSHASHGAQPLWLLFVCAAALVWIAAALALRIPSHEGLRARAAVHDYRLLLKNSAYLRAVGFMFLAYFTLHGPMLMFPLFVRERGGDVATLSQLWVAMLVVEIPLVVYSGAIFARFGPRRVLAFAAAAGGLRWVVCGLTQTTWLVYVMQLLHALVVSGLLVGGVLLVESLVPERLRSTAQAGLTMIGANLGGVLASVAAGAAVERFGIDALYVTAGTAAIVAALCSPWLLPARAEARVRRTSAAPRAANARAPGRRGSPRSARSGTLRG